MVSASHPSPSAWYRSQNRPSSAWASPRRSPVARARSLACERIRAASASLPLSVSALARLGSSARRLGSVSGSSAAARPSRLVAAGTSTRAKARLPAPRRVRDRPFVRLVGPTVWSALALTVRADGSSDFELVGASSFPRHWIYDRTCRLAAKTGLIDFRSWYAQASPEHSPWGDEESPAIVTAVESAMERDLSLLILGTDPPFMKLLPGETLVEQGAPGEELFLLFDGVLAVERDGETIAEVGPGAILGEMALFEGGRRTATLRAVTACRVAIVPSDRVDHRRFEELAGGRKQEGEAQG